MTRPHTSSRYPNACWTDGVSSKVLNKSLHHDSPLTPNLLPTHVPDPAGTQVCVTLPTPMRRTFSCRGRRRLFKETGLARIPGRTRCRLLPLGRQVTTYPGFSPGSLASQGTAQSLETGMAICLAHEKHPNSFFCGRIQSCILCQNKE